LGQWFEVAPGVDGLEVERTCSRVSRRRRTCPACLRAIANITRRNCSEAWQIEWVFLDTDEMCGARALGRTLSEGRQPAAVLDG
jgi:hypothetical protein